MQKWHAVVVDDICSDLDALADRLNKSEPEAGEHRRTWKVDRNIWIRYAGSTTDGPITAVTASNTSPRAASRASSATGRRDSDST